MKGKHLTIILWLFLFSSDLYGEADSVNYQKKRSHFFAVGFIYDTFPYSRYSEFHGHFKYGTEIIPRHTIEIGARTPTLAPKFIMKYSYDLVKKNKWIFGISASVLLGLNYDNDVWCGEDSSIFMCFGASVNFFVERLISENISILVRAGIGPPTEGRLTSLSNLNLSTLMGEETFSIGLGGRYHFH